MGWSAVQAGAARLLCTLSLRGYPLSIPTEFFVILRKR